MHDCAINGGCGAWSGKSYEERRNMESIHFTSGAGRIRPVENLSVPVDAESLAEPFTPLRTGGVEDATSVLVVAPFIVVIGRRWPWEFSAPWLLNHFTCVLHTFSLSMLGAFRPTAAVSGGLLWSVYAMLSLEIWCHL